MAEDQGAAAFGARADLARAYAAILATTGIEWGLLGPREADRVWSRHLLNSAALAAPGLIPDGATVVDVGSGAGLPGIPLAIARPDLRVTLLEPLLRRYTFLERTVAALGLDDQVVVVRGRAEDQPPGTVYDAVVCRAVAPLARLLGWCVPLVAAPHGQLLALKGDSASDEVAAAVGVLRRAGLVAEIVTPSAAGGDGVAVVVRVVRRGGEPSRR